MTVKRYEMDHKGLPFEDKRGSFVLYGDYAALEKERDELAAENAQLKEVFDSVTNLENEPEYHESGMGCGLEDRGITGRYEAMSHGWECAMERVYGEVIPSAEEFEFKATDAALAEIRAQGVEMFAVFCREKAEVRAYNFFSDAAINAEEFAAELRKGAAV